MKKLTLLLIVLPSLASAKQFDTLTISGCFDQAISNHPYYNQKELNDEISQFKIANVNKTWLPSVSLDGQATYQSDVVETGFFSAPKDQYKIYLDINQQLYDGGISKQQKELENSNLLIEQQQINIEFHTLKQQVNSVYFSALILEKNIILFKILHEELLDKHKDAASAVKNGVMLPSNEEILMAEILKLEQQTKEAINKRQSLINILEILIGEEIPDNVVLKIPNETNFQQNEKVRPEIQLFDYQKITIENSLNLNKSINRPKLFAFSQAGYGKPGLNMLNEEFDTYYIVGLGLKWKLINWGELHNKQKIATLQKDAVDLKKENFDKNISVSLQNELAVIENYRSAIKKDSEIIELRKSITQNAYSQFENGVITATQYLAEVNAETQAKIELETHKILLIQSVINYQLIKGDL